MLKSQAGLSFITWTLLITLFSAGCAMPGLKPDHFTVPEVWQDAGSLNGKEVRVRGYGFFEVVQSLVLCDPERCDCNESNGTLVLVEEEIQPGHSNKINDLAQIYVSGKSLDCRGDECTMECSPFNPTAADEFEFVGTLTSEYGNLYLEDLDLMASRQRVNNDWIPIETGKFSINLASLYEPPAAALPKPTLSSAQLTETITPPDVWISHGPGAQGIGSLVIDPATPATLYAGTGNGVLKSTDGGGNWRDISSGLTNTQILDLVIDPVSPSTLYAATWGGVYKSTDGGESWNAAGTGMMTPYIHALAIDPQTPSILYAGSDGSGVFKTTNGGESWKEASHGLLDPFSNALAVDPGTPAVVYTATSNGLYKSIDRAESWSRVDHDLTTWNITILAIDPQKPATLFAGGHGVYKSTDGGVNWSSVSAGLPDVAVSALAIDPQQPFTLYAATARGAYKTTDGCLSWHPLGNGLAYAMLGSLVIDPVTPATLYVGTAGGDVYVIHQTK
jgi:photosystem II stability/assembly factor-like uncharacterized protein